MREAAPKKKNSGGPIVFTGCNLIDAAREPMQLAAAGGDAAAQATKPAAKRREVSVNGRRVKTIDVHCHCVIPETLKLMGMTVESQRGPGLAEVGERRLREMDEQGIDVEALSINPYWYKADRDLAAEVVRINNERLAEFCATYPERIVAFASVALQFPGARGRAARARGEEARLARRGGRRKHPGS